MVWWIATTIALLVLGVLGATRHYHGPSLGGVPCRAVVGCSTQRGRESE